MARQTLTQLAKDHLSGVRYETLLRVSGDPAKTILEVERTVRADLLVMATHGFHGVFHLLLGSLTEKMMRESSCPVLSLRQPAQVPHPPHEK
jgi:nucleotide-binding universal stress UspA family protein